LSHTPILFDKSQTYGRIVKAKLSWSWHWAKFWFGFGFASLELAFKLL